MSSGVPKSNPELEAALTNCCDASQLGETLLSTLAAQGQIVRTQTDAFDNRLIQRTEPNAPLPASNYRFEREIRFHPESGKRTLLIRGNSQQDLDALEA